MGLLYTKAKIFHFKGKLDSLLGDSSEILAPIHIRIKPTNICSHKCRYCAYGNANLKTFGKDKVDKISIPREKMMEIIEDAIGMGVKAVTFSGGGEPFVYPHLLEAVKRLSKAHVKFAALTNGSFLQGEVAKVFALHGTWVRVSMDGWDDKSYSLYRGVPYGEFTKIINNMKAFKAFNGKCYLSVSLIVDKKNGPHVYEILKKLKDVGVSSVKISPCLVNDNAIDNNNYHKPFFHKVKKQVEKSKVSLASDSFEIFDAYAALDEKFEKDYAWCPYLQILPVIGADLNVYACPDKAYNLKNGVVGSIKERRLKDFWFSDKNKFFKINPSKHCNHHCETNQKNRLVLEYLCASKEHLDFV
jgi:MoaA/NifB/PqqE/SkfB family radical SAM enzyme